MSFGKIISIMNTKNNALNFNDSKSNDQNHINLKKRSISNVDPKEQQQRSHRVQSSTPSKNSRTRRNQIRSPQNIHHNKRNSSSSSSPPPSYSSRLSPLDSPSPIPLGPTPDLQDQLKVDLSTVSWSLSPHQETHLDNQPENQNQNEINYESEEMKKYLSDSELMILDYLQHTERDFNYQPSPHHLARKEDHVDSNSNHEQSSSTKHNYNLSILKGQSGMGIFEGNNDEETDFNFLGASTDSISKSTTSSINNTSKHHSLNNSRDSRNFLSKSLSRSSSSELGRINHRKSHSDIRKTDDPFEDVSKDFQNFLKKDKQRNAFIPEKNRLPCFKQLHPLNEVKEATHLPEELEKLYHSNSKKHTEPESVIHQLLKTPRKENQTILGHSAGTIEGNDSIEEWKSEMESEQLDRNNMEKLQQYNAPHVFKQFLKENNMKIPDFLSGI
eukprot:gb/GECH01007721.1/.p1 GENE.gb/GECH01007721.1/~~gb/GECH01007721.1/.p1  ORF type:complete len:443 (+),score=129.56 gb/GECH01007721.1/:1-1329(+)